MSESELPTCESYSLELRYDDPPENEAAMRADVEEFFRRLRRHTGRVAYTVVPQMHGPRGPCVRCTVTPTNPKRFRRYLGRTRPAPGRRPGANPGRRTLH